MKVDEKCKGLLGRFVVVANGTIGEPAEESAVSSTQAVNRSYVCLVQWLSNCGTRTTSGTRRP